MYGYMYSASITWIRERLDPRGVRINGEDTVMSTDTTPLSGTRTRVAVVTGGSGGIGRTVAERLAADGMSVVIGYAGNPERAEEAVKAITASGGTAVAVRADVADEAEVAALFDRAEGLYGGVDVVVHTAGIMVLAPLVDLDFDDFDRMHRTNVRGTFVVDQQAARRLRAGGALINFSTSVTKLASPTYSAYAATKGAVDALTLILARELRGRDVTVNAVAPGPTATPLFLNGKDQSVIDRLAGITPLERLGTPEDVAEVVALLAGPGRWINGQVVYVNGGAV
jgi:3-oxoacyl-[acyl-carrier protein] reductase